MLTRQQPTSPHVMGMEQQPVSRKRKAQSQENERLSKRLSLLHIGMDGDGARLGGGHDSNSGTERDGSRHYVPAPAERPTHGEARFGVSQTTTTTTTTNQARPQLQQRRPPSDDAMILDDSKHKVYIYNLDDELSSESEDDSGRLVFLSDLDKHLRSQRIPASLVPHPDDNSGMQMVLYREPTSITVPEEQDSVRRAVAEARARLREQQRQRREGQRAPPSMRLLTWGEDDAQDYDPDAMDLS